MWADTLLAAERAHLLRLALWGAASLLIGTALVAMLRLGRPRSPLLKHFGIQTGAWGAVELGVALLLLPSLALRDLSGATRLDRRVWMNIGLDVGYVLVGITLVVIGWRAACRAQHWRCCISCWPDRFRGDALPGDDSALCGPSRASVCLR
jgi:hypothetical protein